MSTPLSTSSRFLSLRLPAARRVLATCALAVLMCFWTRPGHAQTGFVDFNTAGGLTNRFNLWNDAGGTDGGNYAFAEGTAAGVGGISVFQSTDTTATYKAGSWDFSTTGAALTVSFLFQANGLTSGDKIQLGILNTNHNGLNNNAGVAFESFRLIPLSPVSWGLYEQYRSQEVLSNNL